MTTPRRRPMLLAASMLLSTLLPMAPAALAATPIVPLASEVTRTRAELSRER